MLQICHAWAFLKRSNSWSGTAGGSSALGHGTGQGALRERGMGRTWSENGDQYHPISHGTWQWYQEHLPFISIYFNHPHIFPAKNTHTESSWHRWRFQPSCCWSSFLELEESGLEEPSDGWLVQLVQLVHGTMAPWSWEANFPWAWDSRRSWLRSLPGGESAATALGKTWENWFQLRDWWKLPTSFDTSCFTPWLNIWLYNMVPNMVPTPFFRICSWPSGCILQFLDWTISRLRFKMLFGVSCELVWGDASSRNTPVSGRLLAIRMHECRFSRSWMDFYPTNSSLCLGDQQTIKSRRSKGHQYCCLHFNQDKYNKNPMKQKNKPEI